MNITLFYQRPAALFTSLFSKEIFKLEVYELNREYVNMTYEQIISSCKEPMYLLSFPEKIIQEILNTRYDYLESIVNPKESSIHFIEKTHDHMLKVVDFSWEANQKYTKHERGLDMQANTNDQKSHIFVLNR